MRRKNFILVTFLFLFINILGFANEKSKDIDVISILDKERGGYESLSQTVFQ